MKVPGPWMAVPMWIVGSSRITSTEKLVLMYLLALRNSERTVPRKASIRAVEVGIHVSNAAARRALEFFTRSRLVEKDEGGYRLAAMTGSEPDWRGEGREKKEGEKPTEERIQGDGANILDFRPLKSGRGARAEASIAELIRERVRARRTRKEGGVEH